MKTVLIVDDIESVLKVTEAALEGQGYTILTATTGEQAIETAAKARPDLVILDYDLGESVINGEQTCVILRRTYPTIPIICTSGVADRMDISDILRACADEFVAKGTSLRYLRQLVYDKIGGADE